MFEHTLKLNPKRAFAVVMVIILAALVLDAADASAKRLRLEPVQHRRDSSALSTDRGETASRTVRLCGVMRYTQRSGLSIDGTPIFLSGGTAFFPTESELPSPRSLAGKKVTVYGTESRLGLRADMIIDHKSDSAFSFSMDSVQMAVVADQPGPNPNVGTLGESTPQ